MNSIIAYVAIATLLVSSAAGEDKFTVTCKKATHGIAYFTKADCSGEYLLVFGFTNSGDCVEVPSIHQLSNGVSAKLTISPDGTTVGQVGYKAKGCTGAQETTVGLLNLDNYTIGECKTVGISPNAYGVKALKLTPGVYPHWVQGTTCDEADAGTVLSFANGVCYASLKVTCSDDAKKYDVVKTTDTCGGAKEHEYKGHESGKCYDHNELAGAGKLSLSSSFAIIALAFLFLHQ